MAQVNPIPQHLRSVTPNLVCRNAAEAIEFYKKVFGATERYRTSGPDGKVMHAEIQIGDSIIFVAEPMARSVNAAPAEGTVNPINLHLYVPNADQVFQLAVDAGARVDVPIQDMFWGDRYGLVTDPYGQQWGIATRKEDVSQEEMAKRTQALFARGAGGA